MADTWYKSGYFSALLRNSIFESDAQSRGVIDSAVLVMALYNDDIDAQVLDTDGLTEVATPGSLTGGVPGTTGYQRISAAQMTTAFATALYNDGGNYGGSAQTGPITFGTVVTTPWSTINSVAIIDTQQKRVWLYSNLGTAIVPVVSSTILYPAGTLTISEGPIE